MSARLLPNMPGPRSCLKCGKAFDSSHAGNRICKKCTKVNASVRISEAELQSQRGAKRHNGFDLEILNAYEMPLP